LRGKPRKLRTREATTQGPAITNPVYDVSASSIKGEEMTEYIVSFDLHSDEVDVCPDFFVKIEGLTNPTRLQTNVWIIDSSMTAKETADSIFAHLDSDDGLFVSELSDRNAVIGPYRHP
jgi:hypothetical protein